MTFFNLLLGVAVMVGGFAWGVGIIRLLERG